MAIVCLAGADTTHYLETECMREAMEEVLYSNGVDVVLNGHLHEYERTNPVFVSHCPDIDSDAPLQWSVIAS